MSYGAGHRHGLDLALLWLWHRPAATAPIRPLGWESPYAAGAALEKAKRHTHTHTHDMLLINNCILNNLMKKNKILKIFCAGGTLATFESSQARG